MSSTTRADADPVDVVLGPAGSPTHRESSTARVAGFLALVAAIAITVVGKAAEPLADPDLWWHLRVGEEFRTGAWSVSAPGFLSSFGTESWDARSWLPEIGISWVEHTFGLPGVAWVFGLGLVLVVIGVYGLARRYADVLVSGLVTVLVAQGASMSLTERPHMVSYVFLLLTVGAWRATIDDRRPRWWIVPMTWIWAACHGMWWTGVMLGVAVIVGMAMQRRLDRTTFLRLGAVPAASIVAATLTPLGLRVLTGAAGSYRWQPYISEFASPSLRAPAVLVTWAMIAVVLATWLRRPGPIPWSLMAMVAFAALWTLYAARSVTWGALIMTPLVAEAIQSWIPGGAPSRPRRGEVGAVVAVGAVALAALAVAVPTTSAVPGIVPTGLDDELAALPEGTPIFNEYALGGWLEWEHRNVEPFIDGNSNAYTFEHFTTYREIEKALPGWRQHLRSNDLDHVLLNEDDPLPGLLTDDVGGWHVVATDAGFVLLERDEQG